MITLAEVQEFDKDAEVRDVITRLLLAALPPDVRAAAPDLVNLVAAHPDVARHIEKLWSDVTESEGKVIAREVGLIAHDAATAERVMGNQANKCVSGERGT